MPWCPNCLTEYREGFDTCAECHVPLVNELPVVPSAPTVDYGEPVLLATLDDIMQADMLLSLLQEQGIPSFKKSHGLGGYFSIYMNAAYMGTQVYVPDQLLAQAQELVELCQPQAAAIAPLGDDAETLSAASATEEAQKQPFLRRAGRLLLWLWLIGVVLMALLILGNPLKLLFFG